MKLSRLLLADLFLLAVACVCFWLIACFPEPQPDPNAALIEKYAPVLEDAGLGAGLSRLRGVDVRVHPKSDGGSFPSHIPGFKWLYDYGGEACASYPGPRVLWVADFDEYVCHGFGHIARTDLYWPDAGCLDMSDDHGFFDSVALDRKCREATP